MSEGTNLSILVVGSGGREHALCWKLSQSQRVKGIYCAPGNGGTASTARTKNVPIKVDDHKALVEFSKSNSIDLVLIGPDDPLAAGLADALESEGLLVFGPRKEAARLEWSKTYAKEFMTEHGLPTAKYLKAQSYEKAIELAKENAWAQVIKYDGLALGKGVFVCDSQSEVKEALDKIFVEKSFGSDTCVLLEERLKGEELSLLYFCDGKNLSPMPACQDHKRRNDGDLGPNTGGMGAFSPVDLYNSLCERIERDITLPLQKALRSLAVPFKGVLYAGLMVDEKDQPYILEFNARFGDPETQVLMPLLKSDLTEILFACAQGKLADLKISWQDSASCCVVVAAKDYPFSSSKGETIEIGDMPKDCQVFHAGTAFSSERLTTNGGRVLAVTAVAKSIAPARDLAYKALANVRFSGMDYRSDIAGRAVKQCLSS